ncbi:putative bifunctional diguanylate cyclase/phosphodiesterase [Parapontixanthobacter aurantiacus]|nr:EAL domain-containing protein [Parapontixanthobacter aurantiacus]
MTYAEKFEDRWFWETDSEGRLTYLSESVSEQIEAFGIRTIGEPLANVFKLDQSEYEHARSLQFHLVSRTPFAGYPVRGQKGLSESWWSMSGRPWVDDFGQYRGFIGSGTDLTKSRKQEATIKRLALTDSLTELANRQRMQDTLNALLEASSNGGSTPSILLLDLDGFKAVNDTLGHPAGDALLVQVSRRLLKAVGQAGIVGRLGGDEFEVLVPACDDRTILSELASKIIEKVSEPYLLNGCAATVSCSIGISVADESDPKAETLIRNADIALYAAKDGGRATYRFYEEQMLARAKWRKELEDDLRLALNADQLGLIYQPIVNTITEKLVGFEALLRWEHPTRGAVSPGEFIPIAEESGLIQQIGQWVLRTATMDLARFPEDLRVAVNVSPIQFSNPDLLTILTNALAESQISPDRLELEITESVFLNDEDASRKTFAALKSLGVRLALDDFGTGYSSLAYLKNAPFDKIKIDQSFVKGAIDPKSRNSAIIEAIVSLSRTLGMETTAEGVEHQDEIELIRSLGCSHIQGYVYGRGAPINQLLPALATGSRIVRPIGPKRSRSRRASLLRSGKLVVHEEPQTVRIRNISETGALIDDAEFNEQMVGVKVLVEALQDELRWAEIRWVETKKAGIEFCEPIDRKVFESNFLQFNKK